MSYTVVANRYAKALFDLAQEQGQLEEVYHAFTMIADSMKPASDFNEFIHNPLLSDVVRTKVLKSLFADKIPSNLERFLFFLNAKGRLSILNDVFAAFDVLYLAAHNRLRAVVKTAQEWGSDEKAQLNRRLNDKFGKDILLNWKIDSALIGGFRVLVGDQLFDYSFKSQLEQYRDKVFN